MRIRSGTTIGAVRAALDAAIAQATQEHAAARHAADFASPHSSDTPADRLEWGAMATESLDEASRAERAAQQSRDARQAFEDALAMVEAL